jgi:hypothetical protein
MRIRVLAFRHSAEIREALRKDGWTLEEGPTPWFSAEHARARDGAAARRRLHRLGLLTSCDLRIEFCEESPLAQLEEPVASAPVVVHHRPPPQAG